jgi:hypothetical protein
MFQPTTDLLGFRLEMSFITEALARSDPGAFHEADWFMACDIRTGEFQRWY